MTTTDMPEGLDSGTRGVSSSSLPHALWLFPHEPHTMVNGAMRHTSGEEGEDDDVDENGDDNPETCPNDASGRARATTQARRRATTAAALRACTRAADAHWRRVRPQARIVYRRMEKTSGGLP